MSKKIENIINSKIIDDFKKNSKFIEDILIVYSEENKSNEFYELMKSGYKTMAKINLELSQGGNLSQGGLKYKFDDINEYEKWLCGV